MVLGTLSNAYESKVGGVSAKDTIEVNPAQPIKAYPPIKVKDLPKDNEVKPLQPAKALTPIEVTELPMVTDVKGVQR